MKNENYDKMTEHIKIAIELSYNIDYLITGYNMFYDKIMIYKQDIITFLKDNNNITSTYILGLIYEKNKEYDEMKKNYEICINNKYFKPLLRLCNYYAKLKNKNMALKYYNIGIKHNPSKYAVMLGEFYGYRLKDYDNMLKYHKLALESGNIDALKSLSKFIPYTKNKSQITDYILLSHEYKYYTSIFFDYFGELLIGNKDLHPDIIDIIIDIDLDNLDKNIKVPSCIYLIKKIYNQKIDILKLHFDYQPGQEGYNSAKQDFIENIKNYKK